jgi:hypothetical protein
LQGQVLGTLKTDDFTDGVCGYARQGSSDFHVHFEVPDTSSLTLSDWTLNTSTGVWTRGAETWTADEYRQVGGKPGDANSDLRVTGVDYMIWFHNYGHMTSRGPADGDFNNNGLVTGVDYVLWRNNYGR